jgi:hypothetical protein
LYTQKSNQLRGRHCKAKFVKVVKKLIESRKTFLGYTNLSKHNNLAKINMILIAVVERKESVWPPKLRPNELAMRESIRRQQQAGTAGGCINNRRTLGRAGGCCIQIAYSEEIPKTVQTMWQMVRTLQIILLMCTD